MLWYLQNAEDGSCSLWGAYLFWWKCTIIKQFLTLLQKWISMFSFCPALNEALYGSVCKSSSPIQQLCPLQSIRPASSEISCHMTVIPHTYKMWKWHPKWSHSSWVGGFKRLVRLQSWEKVMGVQIASSIACGEGGSCHFCHVFMIGWNVQLWISHINKQRHLYLTI